MTATAILSVFLFTLCLLSVPAVVRRMLPRLSVTSAQPIYKEGPTWHIGKSGTPTLGGLSFLLAAAVYGIPFSLVVFFLESKTDGIMMLLCLLFALGNGAVGFLDDRLKIRRSRNDGLTPMQKIALQSILALAFLFIRSKTAGIPSLPFSPVLFYPLAFFALLGTVNAANLTDGIDGLAATVAFAIGLSLFYASFRLGPALPILSALISGTALGFLCYNLHPARIFMGDTGSLYLGGLVSAAVVMLGNPLLLLCFGAVYFVEALSVILQVGYFKISGGKRLFKMAPLHHHLEQCGLSENTICILALILTLLCSVSGYLVLVS